MKKNIIILLLIIPFFFTCEKDKPDSPEGVSTRIEIQADSVMNILYYSAEVEGRLGNTFGHTVKDYGHCWDTLQNPEITGSFMSYGAANSEKTFISKITNLLPGKTYYVKAYFKINDIVKYSNPLCFTTFPLGFAVVETQLVSSIKATSAQCGGTISNDGGSEVTSYGLSWNISGNPTIKDSVSINGSGTGSFNHILTHLNVNTIYYVRAYAITKNGASYGNEISFTTKDGLPEITTDTVTNITAETAISGGTITEDEGLPIATRGVCWSISPFPTVSDNKTTDGTGTGSFASDIAGLVLNTAYYIRAYSTTQQGTSYGNQVQFVTKNGIPVISTTDISEITTNTATSGGNITDDGGFPVISRGICWSISPSPNIAGNKITNGTGLGSYTVSLADLESNTLYYVRAYATNQQGTIYGNEKSFTTTKTPGPTIEFSKYQIIGDNNGDGIINRGEKIYLRVYLKNSGTSVANKVRARISTSDSYISNLYPPTEVDYNSYTSGWDYIDAGEERFGYYKSCYDNVGVSSRYTCDFEISKSILYNTQITFNMDITDEAGHNWTDTFNIQVKQTNALIEFSEYEITSDTDNDEKIESGETIKLKLFVKNNGTSSTKSVSTIISTTSSNILDLNPTYRFVFNGGGGGDDLFNPGESLYYYHCGLVDCNSSMIFQVSPSTPSDSQITFNLDLEDEFNNTWTDSFTITVK